MGPRKQNGQVRKGESVCEKNIKEREETVTIFLLHSHIHSREIFIQTWRTFQLSKILMINDYTTYSTHVATTLGCGGNQVYPSSAINQERLGNEKLHMVDALVWQRTVKQVWNTESVIVST